VIDAIDHAQLFQEGFDLGQRNAGDRRFLARSGVLSRNDAVQVGQAEHIARVNQVRVRHLGIRLPDFRPKPRLFQEARRDIPQRVALLDDIGGRVPVHFNGGSIGGNGQHRRGDDRADS